MVVDRALADTEISGDVFAWKAGDAEVYDADSVMAHTEGYEAESTICYHNWRQFMSVGTILIIILIIFLLGGFSGRFGGYGYGFGHGGIGVLGVLLIVVVVLLLTGRL